MRRLEHRVVLAALASLTPLLLAVAWLLFGEEQSTATRWTVSILALLSFAIMFGAVHAQLDYPLRTLANLISAIREEEWETKFLAAEKHANQVGAFEGAGYEAKGLYRPEVDCIMFTRDEVGFCDVCTRAIHHMIDMQTK